MKILFSILLLAPLFGFSQDCTKILRNTKDRFNDEVMYEANSVIIRNEHTISISFFFAEDDKDMLALFIDSKLGCVDENSKLYFIFSDGSKSSAYNQGGFNCKGKFSFELGTPDRLDDFSFAKFGLRSLRLASSDKQFDIDLTKQESILLQRKIKCLYERIKQ